MAPVIDMGALTALVRETGVEVIFSLNMKYGFESAFFYKYR